MAGNVVAKNITGAPVLDPGQVGQAAPAGNRHLGPVLSVGFRARGFAAPSDTGACRLTDMPWWIWLIGASGEAA